MEHGLTASDIITYAASQGVTISSHQLQRWRNSGLLPRGSKRGLGRGKGSLTLYPPGTEKQAADLARGLARWRREPLAVWEAWLLGHPYTTRAKVFIDHALEQMLAELLGLEGRRMSAIAGRRHLPLFRSARAHFLGNAPDRNADRTVHRMLVDAIAEITGEDLSDVPDHLVGKLSLDEVRAEIDCLPEPLVEEARDEMMLWATFRDALAGKDAVPFIHPAHVGLYIMMTKLAPVGRLLHQHVFARLQQGDLRGLLDDLRPVMPMLVAGARILGTQPPPGRRK